MAASLDELAADAPPEAAALARRLLEQAVSDHAWAQQLGPALTQGAVAALLGKSVQAVAQDRRLLRLHNRDGRPVYPILQFDGRRQVPGVADVVATLRDVVEPLTIASWLTARRPDLDGDRPVDALRAGRTDAILAAARRFARRAAH